ncbi:MAG: response regulator [Myxococcales bacterium]
MSNLILLVEDEADQRELLVELLQYDGYRAVGAASGKEALSAVAKECPRLVLCDLNLPDMDGRELCRHVYEMCPQPPTFVFLTGVTSFKTGDIPQERILKPVIIEDLLAVVARHVRPTHDDELNAIS